MDAGLKKRWVEALRSGKYKQTKYVYYDSRSGGGFCCIGVLATLCGKTKRALDGNDDGVGDLLPALATPGSFLFNHASTLVNMNDGLYGTAALHHNQRSFAEIADYIEANT